MKRVSCFFLSLFILIVLSGQTSAEWAKTISFYPHSGAQSVEQTKDGGYIILAWHRNPSTGENNIWVIKLKSNSEIEWEKFIV